MECVNKFYIEDNNVLDTKLFKEDIIRKGKSLYEVIRVIDGCPLFLKEHLERFNASASLEGLSLWMSNKEIKTNIKRVIEANKVSCGNIKLVFNFNRKKTFLCYFLEHHYPEEINYEEGVKTIFYHGERENPNAKVIAINFRQKVGKIIKEREAYEAILVDRDGYITEGSKSNIFMIKNDNVITAPIDTVLPGITRNTIMDLCNGLGLKVLEERICYKDINDLDGLFISGTSPKVLPIRYIDHMEFNSSKNPIILKIMNAYNEEIKKDILNYKKENK
ncbi:aminotransferase class IV [Clostridium niameyense]|uniref:Aminotransferase class IV n=1 Tax=Clostridium niameyense TaxID=1622073 RepID=A0A6M0R6M8_9CLOT|nr:aminotransferase class IV [Clostridium niameyense]NEZ45846.1 aminotransferase class IV [Clostridium niameyense]